MGDAKGTRDKKDVRGSGGRGYQPTLDGRITTRRVAFQRQVDEEKGKGREKEDRSREEEFKNEILEEVKKIRQEKLEMDKVKLDLLAAMKEVEEKSDRLEKRMSEIEAEWKALKESACLSCCGEDARDGARSPSNASAWSVRSGGSAWSDRSAFALSEREVVSMKRIVYEKDRLERKDNVVIRGVEPTGNNAVEWMKEWFQDRLGVQVNIEFVRKSGPVLVVKVGEGEKKEIMKNKSRLRGTNAFIENDLNLDDRKKQEEIHKWVKEKRSQGWEIKKGTGRIFVNNAWRKWEEREVIEKELEEAKRKLNENFKQALGAGSQIEDRNKNLFLE